MTDTILTAHPTPIHWRAKAKAVAFHLGISGAIFAALFYLIYAYWYPAPFFETDGGWQGLRLVFAIDVVLGPIITFIIFNPTKSRRAITFDLFVIAVAQSAALTWGVWTVYDQRPVAAVVFKGAFHPTTAGMYAAQHVSLDKVYALSPTRPALLYAREQSSLNDWIGSSLFALNKQLPPYSNFDALSRLEAHTEAAFAARLSPKFLRSNPKLAGELAQLAAARGLDPAKLVLMPFAGRYGRAILVFKPDGSWLGSLLG